MSEAINIAKHYFDLSNSKNLDEIRKLFTPSSTYSSENTGVYLGVDQIVDMQSNFFKTFSKLQWDIHDAEEVRPGVVKFDFTIHAEKENGEKVTRPGIEYVIVFQGKLQHVEVRNKK